jgi:signal recognition particle subunit SRP54
MIPGMGGIKKKLVGVDLDLDGKEVKHMEAIILSMTPKERLNVNMIDAKRRKRIAMGSGTSVSEVNKLLKQFDEMRKMMRSLGLKANQQQATSSKKSKSKKGKNKKSATKPKIPNFAGLLGGIGKFPFMKK